MGAVYPLWIEKLVFVLIIASGIYAGYALGEYVWSGFTPNSAMWPTTCHSISDGRYWKDYPINTVKVINLC